MELWIFIVAIYLIYILFFKKKKTKSAGSYTSAPVKAPPKEWLANNKKNQSGMHNEDSEDDNLATFTLSGGRNAEYSITATQRQNFSKTTGISTWDYGYGYSGRESLSRSGSADNFAWSLGAGVRYDVTPDVALDLSYRYLDAGDSSVSYKDEWGDKYKSEVDVKSHDIMLGMTYNF